MKNIFIFEGGGGRNLVVEVRQCVATQARVSLLFLRDSRGWIFVAFADTEPTVSVSDAVAINSVVPAPCTVTPNCGSLPTNSYTRARNSNFNTDLSGRLLTESYTLHKSTQL